MYLKIEKLVLFLGFTGFYFGVVIIPDLPVFAGYYNTIDMSLYIARGFDLIVSLLIFLIVSFNFIPNYLVNGRLLRFLVAIIIIVFLPAIVEYVFDIILSITFNLPTEPGFISDKILENPRRKTLDLSVLPGNIVIMVLAVMYGLSRDWIRKSIREKELLSEKLQSDLDLLRSQINPHFFFNSLNNIFAITQRNKDDEAGEAILKLSDMMRFMIYENNVQEITLEKEIQHQENYLEIARLKFDTADDLDIVITQKGKLDQYRIAPLLLFTFVENAVKHGLKSRDGCFIHINICVTANTIFYQIENSLFDQSKNNSSTPGIGLENVQKRLQLLYPKQHELKINQIAEKYKVELYIKTEMVKCSNV